MCTCLQVKQLTAAALPLIQAFNLTVLNNPAATTVLDQVVNSALVDNILGRLQNVTDTTAPVLQTLLVGQYDS